MVKQHPNWILLLNFFPIFLIFINFHHKNSVIILWFFLIFPRLTLNKKKIYWINLRRNFLRVCNIFQIGAKNKYIFWILLNNRCYLISHHAKFIGFLVINQKLLTLSVHPISLKIMDQYLFIRRFYRNRQAAS